MLVVFKLLNRGEPGGGTHVGVSGSPFRQDTIAPRVLHVAGHLVFISHLAVQGIVVKEFTQKDKAGSQLWLRIPGLQHYIVDRGWTSLGARHSVTVVDLVQRLDIVHRGEWLLPVGDDLVQHDAV